MTSNLLLYFFPPPTYLSQPAYGIDLSDRSLKYVVLTEHRTSISLDDYGEQIIPEGVIQGGVVKDEIALQEVLDQLHREVGIKRAVISLPEEKAFIVPLKTPPVPMRQLRDTLELQLEDQIPLPVGEVEFDYVHQDERVDDYLSLSAIHKGIAASYLKAFQKSEIMPLVFEIEAHALARALIKNGDPGTFMIVDFGRTRTSFVIVSDGIVWFSSTVAIGGDAIAEAIEKKSGLSREAAVHLKETRGLSRSADNKELFSNLTPVVSVLKDEVNKHYLYWNSHSEDHSMPRPKIERILMCGGDANIPGLLEYLSSGLDTPIAFANPWINILPSFDKEIPPMTFNNSLRYATALGLALRKILPQQ
ncbi:hypothetical protein A3A21_03215 [Candidatus Jorgensenbacteria bacterium RIFCSPLOWO2_01_FULL_45_25b]|uniref:SHS2 domain-containing protein n=1 Tax=Candidatus Jorgensenbacteria bacterium RIFCSPLOWO2_01_FULL_45_25b TaxID=1798471 RepID=A0A1F6BU14_9BACT|nr:MAG: hypothetical protein A3A21_03215 [Candidatus Jorgensenbacteria bacterium RIFCSPLOWO2_01_FULL_45_25b]